MGNYDTTSFNYYLYVVQTQNKCTSTTAFWQLSLFSEPRSIFICQSQCCDFNKFLSINTLVHPPLGLSPLALGDLGGAGDILESSAQFDKDKVHKTVSTGSPYK